MAKSDPVVFAKEPISPLLADGLEDLLIFHWQEVESNQDRFPLDVDWPRLLMLERAGKYVAVTARKASKLIGYASYYLDPPTDHASALWAMNHSLYIDPAHRHGRTGHNLIVAAEGILKGLGAELVTQGDRKPFNSTSDKPSATLGDLLLRSGYTLAEKVYAKLL